MSKEKKNRFYYSKKQNSIDVEMWDSIERYTFVKTPDGWKLYSQWCSTKGDKCNWEDAELVFETDEIPDVVVHEGIPEFIEELQLKLNKKDLELRKQVCEEIYLEFEKRLKKTMKDMPVINVAHLINSVLDSVRNKQV